MGALTYDPKSASLTTFYDAVPAFRDGSDDPRAYLERCLETIDAREPEVRAFVTLNVDAARDAADASAARYKAGRPISVVDGMPIAIKDVFETVDMPMEVGSKLFEGHRTGWDAASVWSLRRGGGIILGKTVTTEFAFATPGPTRNPWDTARTPGGSSSGSGAAVGAGMVPVATGTQVRGSVLRPAAFCGAWALKPSHGAINTLGGFPSPPSINHLGILAGSIADMWITAHFLSNSAGGDPGNPSLRGEPTLPKAVKPSRLARLDTAGWAETPDAVRDVFEGALASLSARGVEIVGRDKDPDLEALERDLVELRDVIALMLTYEGRWPLMMYAEARPDALGERVRNRAADGDSVGPDDYAKALSWAESLRERYAALADRYDAFVTLNSVGPAPEGMPVGDVVYGEASSLLRVPALNAPLMAIDGLPLGLQVLGYYRRDWELTAIGHWMIHAVLRGED